MNSAWTAIASSKAGYRPAIFEGLPGRSDTIALAARRTRQQSHFSCAVALQEVEDCEHVLVAGRLVRGDHHRLVGNPRLLRTDPRDEFVARHGNRRSAGLAIQEKKRLVGA